MDLHLIKNLKSPMNKLDSVNKAYVDRIKYTTSFPEDRPLRHSSMVLPPVAGLASFASTV